MTLQDILQEASTLSVDERKQLIKLLVDTLPETHTELPKKRSILEFRGIGEHLRDMDAQEYVNQLRSEWDHRP